MELQESFQETGFQRWRRMFPWLHLLRVPGVAGRLSLVLVGFLTACLLLAVDYRDAPSLPSAWPRFNFEFLLQPVGQSLAPQITGYQLAHSLWNKEIGLSQQGSLLVKLLIYLLSGLLICRLSASLFTTGQKVPLKKAGGFVVRKIPALLMSLLFPLLAIFFLLGLASGLLWLETLSLDGDWVFSQQRPDNLTRQLGEGVFGAGIVASGLLYGPAFLLMWLSNLFGMALIIGWPLLVAALATENSDGFDAWSRSFDYLRSRLFPMVLGFVFTLALGWLVLLVLSLLTQLTFWSMDTLQISLLELDRYHFSQRIGETDWFTAGGFRQFWQTLAVCAIQGYLLTLFWTTITALYVLARQSVDRIPIEEFKA